MADIEKRITDLFSNQDIATTVISAFATILVIWACFYFLYKMTLQSRKCASLLVDLPDKSNTASTTAPDLLNTPIHQFYIKTAYNCCSLGDYANDYVGTCILSSVIKQGVRCLDFEIFSIDDIPVVATSTTNSYNEKETYNSLSFNQVIALISDQAFSGETAPNSTDPLFIHLRIKSNNVKMFWALNELLSKLSNIFIGEVNPSTLLSSLMGKIVVIVNASNKAYLSAGLAHNMISGIGPFYMYKYEHVQTLSPAETKEMQKPSSMTMIIPSGGNSPENIDLNKIIKLQCNMVAMRYQQNDSQLINYNKLFESSAFVLKSDVDVENNVSVI